jgi:hypothetical protein
MGYFPDVHVDYAVHDDNSSCTAGDAPLAKRLAVAQNLVTGYEWLRRQVVFTAPEKRAWRRRLSREYFWHLGYTCLWQNGRQREARTAFRRGLALSPWDWRKWKTACTCELRQMIRRSQPAN